MKKIIATLAATTALMGASTAANAATFIDFEDIAAGSYGASLTIGDVTFSNGAAGGEMLIDNFGNQSIGQGLANLDNDFDDPLLLTFASAVNSLSLVFGNDDICCNSNEGALAVLNLFSGGSLVGSVNVLHNRNDIADQMISFAGASFDSATFEYTNADFTPSALAEVIDNVTFNSVGAVPEPATWAFMIFGFGAVGGALRSNGRRQRKPKVKLSYA